MPVERRAEELKNGAREGTEAVQRDPRRGEQQLRLSPCGYRRQKRCNRGGPKGLDSRRRFADIPKESDEREADGRSCYGREPNAGLASGDAKQESGGDRPDEDNRTGETYSGRSE